MSASYPASVKSFAAVVDGVDYPQAAEINQAYDEIAAIETSLVAAGLHACASGTFTVTLTCGTSGTITVNSSFNKASYTKIGRLVTVSGYVIVSAISSPVGTLALGGLPYPIATSSQREFWAFPALEIGGFTTGNTFCGEFSTGSSFLIGTQASGTFAQSAIAQTVQISSAIGFTMTYVTTS